MTFLLWVVGIWLGVTIFFRLFGKQIVALGMRKIVGRLQKAAEAQQRAYEANFGAGDMREHVYADDEVKVTARKNTAKPAVDLDDFAQDVDFEEINDQSP